MKKKSEFPTMILSPRPLCLLLIDVIFTKGHAALGWAGGWFEVVFHKLSVCKCIIDPPTV